MLVELFGGFQQRSLGWVVGGCAKVGSFNMSGMLNSQCLRLRHSRPAVVEQQAGYHCRCRNRTATYTHSLSTAQHMNSCTSDDSHMSICFSLPGSPVSTATLTRHGPPCNSCSWNCRPSRASSSSSSSSIRPLGALLLRCLLSLVSSSCRSSSAEGLPSGACLRPQQQHAYGSTKMMGTARQ